MRILGIVAIAMLIPGGALAYTECKIRNDCGQCGATCVGRAYCQAGEYNTELKACSRRAACHCIDEARLDRLGTIIRQSYRK